MDLDFQLMKLQNDILGIKSDDPRVTRVLHEVSPVLFKARLELSRLAVVVSSLTECTNAKNVKDATRYRHLRYNHYLPCKISDSMELSFNVSLDVENADLPETLDVEIDAEIKKASLKRRKTDNDQDL